MFNALDILESVGFHPQPHFYNTFYSNNKYNQKNYHQAVLIVAQHIFYSAQEHSSKSFQKSHQNKSNAFYLLMLDKQVQFLL